MTQSRGILIQVGGNGKGCGKTTLIMQLLSQFPGAIFVKSALHLHAAPDGGDQARCLNAGASAAYTISKEKPEDQIRIIRQSLNERYLVFFERNTRLKEFSPDLYVFIEADVSNPRDDALILAEEADIVIRQNKGRQIDISTIRDHICCLFENRGDN